MTPQPNASATQTHEPDWPLAVTECRELLAELIAVDSSNPPGNELAVAAVLKRRLEAAGIECQVFETAPGRGNLVARVRGNGRKRPLLLLGHLDVVGVDRSKWQSDPFTLTERDGFLYARGVIDDKGMVAVEAATLLALKRLDVPLDRDVILLAECDEESGGRFGVGWMLEHQRAAIDAEFALNEGGRTTLHGDRVSWIGIQNAEKRAVNFSLVARGNAGHAAMPREDNCLATLGRALARFAKPVFPVELTPSTREFFAGLADLHDAEMAAAMRALLDPARAEQASVVVGRDLMFGAMSRTTVSPTMVQGGFRANVIPSEAKALLNVRMVPGSDVERVAARIREVIDDPAVEVSLETSKRPESPAMPFSGPVVDAVRRHAATMAPGAPVVPLLSTGATDSAQLRGAGIQAYGLLPFPLTNADDGRMHSDDERMPVSSLGFGLQMMYRVTVDVAGAGS